MTGPTTHGTSIAWTHIPGYKGEVWNPTVGCTRVSPGCDHCYAFALHDKRYADNQQAAGQQSRDLTVPKGQLLTRVRKAGGRLPWPAQYDRPFSRMQLFEDRIEQPRHWRNPRAVFVDSMSDLFHEDVPDEFIARVFDVMGGPQRHIFMVLTKRPQRMHEFLNARQQRRIDYADSFARTPTKRMQNSPAAKAARRRAERPPGNIWLGVSVEDQERADERIPLLLDTPVAVRFVSAEPLLGPVDALQWMSVRATLDRDHRSYPRRELDRLARRHGVDYPRGAGPGSGNKFELASLIDTCRSAIDWIIVGGESGPRARLMDVAWARSIRDQCADAGVPFFYKQGSGGSRPGMRAELDGREHHEWPATVEGGAVEAE